MGTYRETRSVEASYQDFITAQLITDHWSGIRVEQAFAAVYDGVTPVILINEIRESNQKRLELGSSIFEKKHLIAFRIFASDDGQRIDLKDWLLSNIQSGIDYYTYTVSQVSGVYTAAKVKAGRVNIVRVIENKKELEGISNLSQIDKYRHLITVEVLVALS
jgi:hypothetical protein